MDQPIAAGTLLSGRKVRNIYNSRSTYLRLLQLFQLELNHFVNSWVSSPVLPGVQTKTAKTTSLTEETPNNQSFSYFNCTDDALNYSVLLISITAKTIIQWMDSLIAAYLLRYFG